MPKPPVNIVWLKRDLRFTDHEPLYLAKQSNIPVLLIYFFEPSVIRNEDSDVRHWRFVYESLTELKNKLKDINAELYIFHDEVKPVFETLANTYTIQTVFSSEETGNQVTYVRDKTMKAWFRDININWKECQTNGIIRGLKSRKDWQKRWKENMVAQPKYIEIKELTFEKLDATMYDQLKGNELDTAITTRNPNFQQGGEYWAWRYLENFINQRHTDYSKNISSPLLSRKSCSRLSPYLAYGNISMRMVYQFTSQHYSSSVNKRALSNFISRLHWHCHFIQKFESECRYEYENINRAFNVLIKPKNNQYIKAWQTGQTGVPIVDACMRCVVATGYLNFRMRAMVVSFFAYNLWQDWRSLHFLARQFLDYEPGIHYPQLQMQSGTTGINTIRIYSPVKNSEKYDKDGLFIKKWIPELKEVPSDLIHEPHKLTLIEEQLYNCVIGKDYPFPIVDVEETRKKASDIMWSFRKNNEVKKEAKKILEMHVNVSASDMSI